MTSTAVEDERYLNLLSIFHYIVGGLEALFACVPLIHFGVGVVMIFAPVFARDAEALPATFVGVIIAVIAGVVILAGWALAACTIYSGRCLAQKRRHTFCLVIAGVECIFMPWGTVLGVLTLVVLTRPSVKDMFSD